jgi:hypothetical protein
LPLLILKYLQPLTVILICGGISADCVALFPTILPRQLTVISPVVLILAGSDRPQTPVLANGTPFNEQPATVRRRSKAAKQVVGQFERQVYGRKARENGRVGIF